MATRQSGPFEEKRRSSRFPKEEQTDFAAVFAGSHEEAVVPVHDESLGGLSLVVEDVSRFAVGSEMTLAYAGALLQAVVRHVRPRRDGKYVVGFQTRPRR